MIIDFFRKFATFLSIFFINKKINLSRDYKIFKKINIKIKENKIDNKNLRKTHQIFNNRLYQLLKNNNLKNFLRVNFIQKMFFVHNRYFIFKELKRLKKDKNWLFYRKLIKEDGVGNPVRYFLYPESSGNKINHVFHLSILKNEFNVKLKKINKIFEFGGGYGCMARIFSKINKNINYLCFDTYYVNLLQYYYLKHNNLNVGFKKKNNFLLKSDINEIKDYYNKNFKYLFIANWSISETPLNYRKKFEKLIISSSYILICFQEKFENINNLKYFNNLKKKKLKKFKIKIIRNEFYNGNFLNKQKHYFFLGKKL